jgi:hypothetical protein
MTVATPEPSGAIAEYDPAAMAGVGLEDINITDIRIPRLTIEHSDGVFKDSLTEARYEKLTVIVLALVKQRVMWDEDIEDGDKPQCKSPNNVYGFPNVRQDIPAKKQFPWGVSNFEPAHAQPVDVPPATSAEFKDGWTSNGLPVLNCGACKFAKWEGKNPPPCNEQFTYPLFYQPDPDGDPETWTPGIITFSKSGITPAKNFNGWFAQTHQPFFTVYSEITLDQKSRGAVKYSVPKFSRGGATDRAMWGEYAQQALGIRDFLRAAPRGQDDDADTTPPAAPAPAAPPVPAAAPAPTPAPAAPPAAAAPAPTPAAAPVPPPAAPVAPSAPAPAAPAVPAAPAAPAAAAPVAPAPAAPAPPAAPAAPVAPAAEQAPASEAPATSDLPF